MWHPFADMSAVTASGPFVLDRGEGQYLFDESGRQYLDATAGLWFANVGHGRQEIAEAVGAQAARLAHFSSFGDMSERPALELAERVAGLAPVPGSKVFFTSGGSDAVDTAKKLVRRYWNVVGEPQRRVVISRDRAYHGMHWGGTSLAGIDPNREGYGDLQPDVARVPWNDAQALADTIDELGPSTVAAFFCEPVVGAGGVHFAGEDYLRRARAVCEERGVLWVSDEVITGFGRTGEWFASGRFDLRPDLMLTAKGLTSGYVPMGAVIASPRVADPFFEVPGRLWRHGYTYSGHAVAAAAGLANLDILQREQLLPRVRELEPAVTSLLAPLTELGDVSEVRSGVGLLAAVQIDPAVLAHDPTRTLRVVAAMRERGVLTRALADGALQVSPPFVIDESDLKVVAEVAAEAIEATGAR
jgi:putrescine---pyruvate transaminase